MSLTAKSPMVRAGDFFFKWRDLVFPGLLLALFLGVRPGPGVFGSGHIPQAIAFFGLALTASGLGLRFAAIGWAYIIRGGKNKQVYAEDLVTQGYFATCRNPLYVGNILAYTGLFLVHGNPLVIAAGTAIFVFAYVAIVAAEEHFLREKFGASYQAYCTKVARWLPDFRQLRTSCTGMHFSPTRSILKDRVTIFGSCVAIVIIFALQNRQVGLANGFREGARISNMWFWVAFAVLLALLVAVNTAKNRLKRRDEEVTAT
jgi:protein-S-isoprenylcysteine O-methyltransferase Ste14